MERPRGGRLALVVGPMYAGKSSELARRVRRWEHAGLQVMCIKPTCDTRYQEGMPRIKTHDQFVGQALDAVAVDHLSTIELSDETDCLAVDEGQFFDADDLVQSVERWLRADRRVAVSGLDGTYLARPFPHGGAPTNLISLANEVVKLHAVCDRCGSDQATQSHRYVQLLTSGGGSSKKRARRDPAIQVGGTEMYIALCRGCYFEAVPPAETLGA